jgi:hypothetical protein
MSACSSAKYSAAAPTYTAMYHWLACVSAHVIVCRSELTLPLCMHVRHCYQVETGVRMKHIPTGIAVRCTQERSQLMNKALALKVRCALL